ncbi:hypothetical protein EGW08_007090, partial [Elysia chlorotica]
HLLRVLPPLLPLVCVVGCDAEVAYRGVEPHVEHFVLVALQRHWSAPLEVSADAARLQPVSDPRAGDHPGVVGPGARIKHPVEVSLEEWLQLRDVGHETKISITNFTIDHRRRLTNLALRIHKIHSIEEFTTAIALVSPGVVKTAQRTRSLHKPVRQESAQSNKGLSGSQKERNNKTTIIQLTTGQVRSFIILVVKVNVEPAVNLGVQFVEFITNFLGRDSFLHCLCLCGCAILVSATNVQYIVISQS